MPIKMLIGVKTVAAKREKKYKRMNKVGDVVVAKKSFGGKSFKKKEREGDALAPTRKVHVLSSTSPTYPYIHVRCEDSLYSHIMPIRIYSIDIFQEWSHVIEEVKTLESFEIVTRVGRQ
jgi:hypothetical protein